MGTEHHHHDEGEGERGSCQPVGVAEYTLTHDLPKELAGKLPDAQQIEAEILRELGAVVEG